MSDLNVDMINDCVSNGVMFDIGAHQGGYTVLMAEKSEQVYAFEPAPENAEKLRENLKDHLNVEVHEIALSNEDGTAKLMLHPSNQGGHSIHAVLAGQQWGHKEEEFIHVNVLTLDTWCQYNGITRVDGIKIDVEAHEQEVLEGAKDTLKTYHPLISLETHHTIDLKAIQDILEECGYGAPTLEIDRGYYLTPVSSIG